MTDPGSGPDGPTVTETAAEARQGRRGKPVLVILVCALILSAVAWSLAEYWGESIDRDAAAPSVNSPNRIEGQSN